MNANDMLDTTCAATITGTMTCSGTGFLGGSLDITGITYFKNLTGLDVTNDLIYQMPALPQKLTSLKCGGNRLTSLPPLPPGLTVLDCATNRLASLPALPSTLIELQCGSNNFSTLPPLPSGLQTLVCVNLGLSSLPALPATLKTINCGTNLLTSLPSLPKGLTDLICAATYLDTLPTLPDSLKSLDCPYNYLTSLPPLPVGMRYLDCSDNRVTGLPILPDSLIYLHVLNNNISCLPPLPAHLVELWIDTIITCLPNLPASLINGYNWQQLSVCTAPTHCDSMPRVSGRLYTDVNLNGQRDAGEPLTRYLVVQETTAGTFAGSGPDGLYAIYPGFGTFTLKAFPIYPWYKAVPDSYTVTFTQMGQWDTTKHFGFQPVGQVHEVEVSVTALTRARRGRDYQLQIDYTNHGTVIESGEIALTFDTTLAFFSASPLPKGGNTGLLVWDYANLLPLESRTITLTLNVPVIDTLGQPLVFTASVTPLVGDTLQSNNSDSFTAKVVASYDPNEKTVSPEAYTLQDAAARTPLTYTVRFQNTGTDTAFKVVVSDALDANLDWNSLRVLAASHPVQWQRTANIVDFTFNNILLPDSGTDEPASHGFVKYQIQPVAGLQPGDQVHNQAAIYFDYNAPVFTNTAVTEVRMPASVSPAAGALAFRAYPNPASGTLNVDMAEDAPAILRLTDLSGRTLIEQEFPAHTNKTLDVSALAPGLYLLECQSGAQRGTARVCVMR